MNKKVKFLIILVFILVILSGGMYFFFQEEECPCNTIDKNHCYDNPCNWEQEIIKVEKKDEEQQNLSEEEKINIDEYNFEQLEKVKNILNNIKDFNFISLENFNNKYNQSITSIKNCYFLISTNYYENYEGESEYIFGFKLESEKYINEYGTQYYAYPKYDLPFSGFCSGGDNCNTDLNLNTFKSIISKPCE